jgi:hypothetical protein
VTAYELPERAVRPLAAFLWNKSLSPEYPSGGEVTVVARELLDEPVRIAVAEELRVQAEVLEQRRIGSSLIDTLISIYRERADHLDPEGATR